MNLHKTLTFAHEMHAGVNDWTGVPYITHPVFVMLSLPASCSEEDKHIALLHDVVEDCKDRLIEKFDLEQPHHQDQIPKEWQDKENQLLLEKIFSAFEKYGYSPYIIEGLRLLTRDCWDGLTYLEYVKNIIESNHEGAMWVKYCDNKHNNSIERRAKLPEQLLEKSTQMAKRYDKSIALLEEALTTCIVKRTNGLG
jgi:hypothetical protein